MTSLISRIIRDVIINTHTRQTNLKNSTGEQLISIVAKHEPNFNLFTISRRDLRSRPLRDTYLASSRMSSAEDLDDSGSTGTQPFDDNQD
jgi:hypothetical protein